LNLRERSKISDYPYKQLKPSTFCRVLFLLLLQLALSQTSFAETTHQIFFKGTDSELDVYTIKGAKPGPTLMILGGIQGDEPGGYLAADLYADMALRQGNLIVVPRANFLSIVVNNRGIQGDMNRKFASPPKDEDRDSPVVELVKGLMAKADFFLNLHDGSGFYSPKYESPERNPMRFGQSIIADASEHTLPNGKVLHMAAIVERVAEKINPQIANPDHCFHFNNHRTLRSDTKHKEQRLSATYHALTKVGIPAFGIETSKSIPDYRLRVRYQTMVINAFLEEIGIVPESPKIYLDNPYLKFLVVSVNGLRPIVINGNDMLKVSAGDTIRIVHVESNYTRGLSASVKGFGRSFNDLNEEIQVTDNTSIIVRKDRFVIGSVPVEIIKGKSLASNGVHFEPKVKYFCVRVNDKTYALEPGEELTVFKGDTLTLLDPRTNLAPEDDKSVRIDLRGFQAENSAFPLEDRGHRIDSAVDLQEKYGRRRGASVVYPLQARLYNKVFGESYIVVAEPKLEYLVLKDARGGSFVAYTDEKLELPLGSIVRIMDIKTNLPESGPLFITMAGRTVRWREAGDTGIDSSKLPENDVSLEVVRSGKIIGKIWLKQGKDMRLSDDSRRRLEQPYPVRY
jgi:IMP cyclohydrolase